MQSFYKRLTTPSSLKRFLFFFCLDCLLITVSLFFSFVFHFDFDLSEIYVSLLLEVLPFFIAVKLICFGAFKVYQMTWRYVGIFDLVNIVISLVVAAMVLIMLSLPISLFPFTHAMAGFPKRIVLEDAIISVFLIAGLRISKRLYLEVIRKQGSVKRNKRTLVLGAGNTGEMIVRDMARANYGEFYPVGFLDDDKTKMGTIIHGVKVLDTTDRLGDIIVGREINALVIAIPSLNHKKLKEIYDVAKKSNVGTIKIVPRIYNFDSVDINVKGLEDIRIEDLVGRQSVSIDYKEVGRFVKGKSVLITGAGGSIGAEIVNQVYAFYPAKVIAYDIDETELHNLELSLSRRSQSSRKTIHCKVGDVRDEGRLCEVFEEFRPDIVFHAAAYKHVPMMELNPKEAVKVNMFGTYVLARTARKYLVDKFIMISTDKAVRPTSVMGATKRMAEYICKAFNGWEGGKEQADVEVLSSQPPDLSLDPPSPTKFISVRFGNVLGSRGSVLPLFLDQLKHGGPLTVTHKDMKRYFMTIPEAVSLVLQASTMGEGEEVFVLDMGGSARITDVAEELIRIHGMEPYSEIGITFTGLRPGEKLFEEILTAEEGTIASKHRNVYIAKDKNRYTVQEIEDIQDEFRQALISNGQGSDAEVRALLRKYVKHYEETGGQGESGVVGDRGGVETPGIKVECGN
jgi:FlaA1/EpsC-like NDP-sugar epimerase